MISRVCQEFGCMPDVAIDALDRYEDLLFEIMELRAYAEAKHACDEADANHVKPEHYPKGPMVGMVAEIEYALLQERNAHMTEDADGE